MLLDNAVGKRRRFRWSVFLANLCCEMLRSKIERCSTEDGDNKEQIETHFGYQEITQMLTKVVSDV